jgi:hypothetical protein
MQRPSRRWLKRCQPPIECCSRPQKANAAGEYAGLRLT